jgi:hypothetical protein
MATYRAFMVNDDGHFVGVHVLDGCETDDEAISRGKQYVDGCGVQIWSLDRLVARIGQDGAIETP